MDLARQHCKPCDAETPPLEGSQIPAYLEALADRWSAVDDHHLAARFDFADFAGALAFANRVGGVAEAEGHHPEICLTWGRATVRVWTHAIDGLSENDFILAAKIDRAADG